MELLDALAAKGDELVALMMDSAARTPGGSDADTRQFIVGYLHILRAAAAGDFGPRDEYLATVVPAIRDGGMPLGVVMDGMVRVATAAGAVLGPSHTQWLCDFQGDYTMRILELWGDK